MFVFGLWELPSQFTSLSSCPTVCRMHTPIALIIIMRFHKSSRTRSPPQIEKSWEPKNHSRNLISPGYPNLAQHIAIRELRHTIKIGVAIQWRVSSTRRTTAIFAGRHTRREKNTKENRSVAKFTCLILCVVSFDERQNNAHENTFIITFYLFYESIAIHDAALETWNP